MNCRMGTGETISELIYKIFEAKFFILTMKVVCTPCSSHNLGTGDSDFFCLCVFFCMWHQYPEVGAYVGNELYRNWENK